MKTCFLFSLTLALCLTGFAQLNSPESIVYHPGTYSYYISNNGGNSIAVMDSLENITIWATGLSAPAGICVVGDTICCNSSNQVKLYHAYTAELITSYAVSSAGYLNDLDSDGTYFYISDSQRGRVLRMEIATGDWEVIASNLTQVNGVFYDAQESRLLTCAMPQNAPIRAISLPDYEVTTLTATTFSVLDGITMDAERNVYVSSNYVPGFGGNDNIYLWDDEFLNDPVSVADDFEGCADIFYDLINDVLAVPNARGNRIDLLDLSAMSTTHSMAVPQSFTVYDVYPNPFNATASLRFTLTSSAIVKAALFDMLGRKVVDLANGVLPAGDHELAIGSAQLTSGYYFVRIEAPGMPAVTRSAVLIK
ncbi:T9SS type A sorting domain-containing protein [bacterium]|nr:T9SS type A sorting domain-containing protein [bacterium]MBU1636861.1 T9SS type A sorting domain-containing protein [bacterium]MBU1919876.1 T9SS type A sorting domain-containing protein [bacterium]